MWVGKREQKNGRSIKSTRLVSRWDGVCLLLAPLRSGKVTCLSSQPFRLRKYGGPVPSAVVSAYEHFLGV